jgi:hypothetical protein
LLAEEKPAYTVTVTIRGNGNEPVNSGKKRKSLQTKNPEVKRPLLSLGFTA